jgi:hypothetical protein
MKLVGSLLGAPGAKRHAALFEDSYRSGVIEINLGAPGVNSRKLKDIGHHGSDSLSGVAASLPRSDDAVTNFHLSVLGWSEEAKTTHHCVGADFDDKTVPVSPAVAFGQADAAHQSRDYLITGGGKVLGPVDLALRVENGRNVVGRDWLQYEPFSDQVHLAILSGARRTTGQEWLTDQAGRSRSRRIRVGDLSPWLPQRFPSGTRSGWWPQLTGPQRAP